MEPDSKAEEQRKDAELATSEELVSAPGHAPSLRPQPTANPADPLVRNFQRNPCSQLILQTHTLELVQMEKGTCPWPCYGILLPVYILNDR